MIDYCNTFEVSAGQCILFEFENNRIIINGFVSNNEIIELDEAGYSYEDLTSLELMIESALSTKH